VRYQGRVGDFSGFRSSELFVEGREHSQGFGMREYKPSASIAPLAVDGFLLMLTRSETRVFPWPLILFIAARSFAVPIREVTWISCPRKPCMTPTSYAGRSFFGAHVELA